MTSGNTVQTRQDPTLFPSFSAIPGQIAGITSQYLTQPAASTIAPFSGDQQTAFNMTRDIAQSPGYNQNYNRAVGTAAGAVNPGQAFTQGQQTLQGVQSGAMTALADNGNWQNNYGRETALGGLNAAVGWGNAVGDTAGQLGQIGQSLASSGGPSLGLSGQYTQPLAMPDITTGQWNTQAANAYMSPYMQTAMSATLGELQKQHDLARGQAAASAAGSGSFTDRRALMDAAMENNFAQSDAATAAQMANQGYGLAQQGYQTDQARALAAQQATSQQKLGAQSLGLQGAIADQQLQGTGYGLGLQGQSLGINALNSAGALRSGLMTAGMNEQAIGQNALNAGNTAIGNAGNMGLSAANIGINSDLANRSAALNSAQIQGSLTGQEQASDLNRTNALLTSGQLQQTQDQNLRQAPVNQANFGVGVVSGVPYGKTQTVPTASNGQLAIGAATALPSIVNAGVSAVNRIAGTTPTAPTAPPTSMGPNLPGNDPGNVNNFGGSGNAPFSMGPNLPGNDPMGVNDVARGGRIERATGGTMGLLRHVSPDMGLGRRPTAEVPSAMHGAMLGNLRRHLAAASMPKLGFDEGGGYNVNLSPGLPQAVVDAYAPPLERLTQGVVPNMPYSGQALPASMRGPQVGSAAPKYLPVRPMQQDGAAAPSVPGAGGDTMGLAPAGAGAAGALPSAAASGMGLGTPPQQGAPAADDSPFPKDAAAILANFGAGLVSGPGGVGMANALASIPQTQRLLDQDKARQELLGIQKQGAATAARRELREEQDSLRKAIQDARTQAGHQAFRETLTDPVERATFDADPTKYMTVSGEIKRDRLNKDAEAEQKRLDRVATHTENEANRTNARGNALISAQDRTPAELLTLRGMGIDPASPQGRDMLLQMKGQNREPDDIRTVRAMGFDPASPEGQAKLIELKRAPEKEPDDLRILRGLGLDPASPEGRAKLLELKGHGPGAHPLVPVPDETSPTGYKWANRTDAEGKPAIGPTGTMMEFGPDGKPVAIKIGAPTGKSAPISGMEKPTVNLIEKQLQENAEHMAKINNIDATFRPEFLQIPTKLGAEWQSLKSKLGANIPPDKVKSLTEYRQFRQNSLENSNQYIHDLTGAAMGIQEGKRLLSTQPNVGEGLLDGDDPVSFKAKLDNTKQQLRYAIMRKSYALNNGLDPLKTGVELGDVPKLVAGTRDRVSEKLKRERPDLDATALQAETNAQVKKMFGIP